VKAGMLTTDVYASLASVPVPETMLAPFYD
jgi:hypothetical protein